MRLRKSITAPHRYEDGYDDLPSARPKNGTKPAYPKLTAAQAVPFNPNNPAAAFPSLPLFLSATEEPSAPSHPAERMIVSQNTQNKHNTNGADLRKNGDSLMGFAVDDDHGHGNNSNTEKDATGSEPEHMHDQEDDNGIDTEENPRLEPDISPEPGTATIDWCNLPLALQYRIFQNLCRTRSSETAYYALDLNARQYEEIRYAIVARELHWATSDELWTFVLKESEDCGEPTGVVSPEILQSYSEYLIFARNYEFASEDQVQRAKRFLGQRELGLDLLGMWFHDPSGGPELRNFAGKSSPKQRLLEAFNPDHAFSSRTSSEPSQILMSRKPGRSEDCNQDTKEDTVGTSQEMVAEAETLMSSSTEINSNKGHVRGHSGLLQSSVVQAYNPDEIYLVSTGKPPAPLGRIATPVRDTLRVTPATTLMPSLLTQPQVGFRQAGVELVSTTTEPVHTVKTSVFEVSDHTIPETHSPDDVSQPGKDTKTTESEQQDKTEFEFSQVIDEINAHRLPHDNNAMEHDRESSLRDTSQQPPDSMDIDEPPLSIIPKPSGDADDTARISSYDGDKMELDQPLPAKIAMPPQQPRQGNPASSQRSESINLEALNQGMIATGGNAGKPAVNSYQHTMSTTLSGLPTEALDVNIGLKRAATGELQSQVLEISQSMPTPSTPSGKKGRIACELCRKRKVLSNICLPVDIVLTSASAVVFMTRMVESTKLKLQSPQNQSAWWTRSALTKSASQPPELQGMGQITHM